LDLNIVILCGGTGSRLWPLSREGLPKQFLRLPNDEHSFFQNTLLRCRSLSKQPLTIICNMEHRFLVAAQLKVLKIENANIILEPIPCNTAPAIAIACLFLQTQKEDPSILVLPSDHIMDANEFCNKVKLAARYAEQRKIVTLGVTCQKAETAYGYIKTGDLLEEGGHAIERFIEKPDLQTAESFIQAGNYYWNSGMFLFKASLYLNQLEQFRPEILAHCQTTMDHIVKENQFIFLPQEFKYCEEISIDNAIMEYTQKGVMVAFNGYWSDVGSWYAMWEAQEQDSAGNVIHGEVIVKDVNSSYLHATHRILTALGLNDVIVIETADAVLVANKNYSQQVKDIVKKFKVDNHSIISTHKRVFRPWGEYEVLVEGPGYKVKHIYVNPGCSLSLQLHHFRSEHWVVVRGIADVTRGDEYYHLKSGESTFIPLKTKHRLENTQDAILEIIETQIGNPLFEADIVRFQDLYGRIGISTELEAVKQ
jgi:mannose-1-phosphate guanylyltransferase